MRTSKKDSCGRERALIRFLHGSVLIVSKILFVFVFLELLPALQLWTQPGPAPVGKSTPHPGHSENSSTFGLSDSPPIGWNVGDRFDPSLLQPFLVEAYEKFIDDLKVGRIKAPKKPWGISEFTADQLATPVIYWTQGFDQRKAILGKLMAKQAITEQDVAKVIRAADFESGAFLQTDFSGTSSIVTRPVLVYDGSKAVEVTDPKGNKFFGIQATLEMLDADGNPLQDLDSSGNPIPTGFLVPTQDGVEMVPLPENVEPYSATFTYLRLSDDPGDVRYNVFVPRFNIGFDHHGVIPSLATQEQKSPFQDGFSIPYQGTPRVKLSGVGEVQPAFGPPALAPFLVDGPLRLFRAPDDTGPVSDTLTLHAAPGVQILSVTSSDTNVLDASGSGSGGVSVSLTGKSPGIVGLSIQYTRPNDVDPNTGKPTVYTATFVRMYVFVEMIDQIEDMLNNPNPFLIGLLTLELPSLSPTAETQSYAQAQPQPKPKDPPLPLCPDKLCVARRWNHFLHAHNVRTHPADTLSAIKECEKDATSNECSQKLLSANFVVGRLSHRDIKLSIDTSLRIAHDFSDFKFEPVDPRTGKPRQADDMKRKPRLEEGDISINKQGVIMSTTGVLSPLLLFESCKEGIFAPLTLPTGNPDGVDLGLGLFQVVPNAITQIANYHFEDLNMAGFQNLNVFKGEPRQILFNLTQGKTGFIALSAALVNFLGQIQNDPRALIYPSLVLGIRIHEDQNNKILINNIGRKCPPDSGCNIFDGGDIILPYFSGFGKDDLSTINANQSALGLSAPLSVNACSRTINQPGLACAIPPGARFSPDDAKTAREMLDTTFRNPGDLQKTTHFEGGITTFDFAGVITNKGCGPEPKELEKETCRIRQVAKFDGASFFFNQLCK